MTGDEQMVREGRRIDALRKLVEASESVVLRFVPNITGLVGDDTHIAPSCTVGQHRKLALAIDEAKEALRG